MQVGEQTPFIDEMLKNLSGIICDLAPSQVRQPHTPYAQFGCAKELGVELSWRGCEPQWESWNYSNSGRWSICTTLYSDGYFD